MRTPYGHKVYGIAAEYPSAAALFHAAEQVRLHVAAVAAGMIRREAEELVEIERARLGQIDFAEFGQRSELLVKANRGAAGRQSHDQLRRRDQLHGDASREGAGDCRFIFENGDARRTRCTHQSWP